MEIQTDVKHRNEGQSLVPATTNGFVCSSQCDPAAPSRCPEGKTCFSYTAEHGEHLAGVSACFKPELLPQLPGREAAAWVPVVLVTVEGYTLRRIPWANYTCIFLIKG